MSASQKIGLTFKALRELGPRQVGLYAGYRLGLWSGYFERRTAEGGQPEDLPPAALAFRPLFPFPDRASLATALGPQAGLLLAEAGEILGGRVRLFGGSPVPLELSVTGAEEHWTRYESGAEPVGDQPDVKWVWEPGRFGWAFTLGRAYRLSGEECYPEAFWAYVERFLEANPANRGPHWASAQEVALRLISLAFAAQAFAGSAHSTEHRLSRLAEVIAAHAKRIPPTLVYARAQNNNHLLTEAAGLYTAGLSLPGHPEAGSWRALGWRWLNRALQTQIEPDGGYVQQSANYHRLMLQAALWANRLAGEAGQPLPEATRARLAAAARWLLALVDPESGQAPNLGPNDGAYILPLSACSFADYRPVAHCAALAFLGERLLPAGAWDEMALWLVGEDQDTKPVSKSPKDLAAGPPVVIRSPARRTWAYLRAARFSSRPGHADQLHVDLWWRGLNVAQDAGTYLYNAAPPWNNALARTAVHNTLTVNGRDQMTRAGRFLWLDRAQGTVIAQTKQSDGAGERVIAQHDGYRRLGVIHRREMTALADGGWRVTDQVLPAKGQEAAEGKPPGPAQADQGVGLGSRSNPGAPPVTARLHWLLPDWPFAIVEKGVSAIGVQLESPQGPVELRVAVQPASGEPTPAARAQLIRAGELLHGSGEVDPTWGWAAPTYGLKIPALALAVSVEGRPPLHLTSEWRFPNASGES